MSAQNDFRVKWKWLIVLSNLPFGGVNFKRKEMEKSHFESFLHSLLLDLFISLPLFHFVLRKKTHLEIKSFNLKKKNLKFYCHKQLKSPALFSMIKMLSLNERFE